MRSAFVCVAVLICAGCSRPLQLITDSRVEVTSPLQGRVTLDVAPSIPADKGGQVVEMPLGGGRPCKGAKVALIDIDGLLLNQNVNGSLTIGENPVALFKEKLAAAAADPGVCALVLRINSPGGGVTATDIMWQELQHFRSTSSKPVVACLMDVGTGGGYYVATASDHIVAHPTTVTGGIGVIWNSYNLRDLMGLFNMIPQSVKSGPNIDLGSTTHALSPENKQLLQQMADEFHDRFKTIVKKSRPRVDPDQETTFDGRVFTAEQARKRGLIDSIGYLDDALATARALAKQPVATAVMYPRRNDPAYSPYAVSGNASTLAPLLQMQVPGLDRSRLPAFLYLWQPDPVLDNH